MRRLARLLGLLVVSVVTFGIVPPLVPVALRQFAPPVRGFEVTSATRLTDGSISLRAQMEKRWCVFRALVFAYRAPGGMVWRVGYEPSDQPANVDRNRPPGFQSLGPWIVAPPPAGGTPAQRLMITARHRCGLFDVVTPLADLSLDRIE